MIFPSTCMELYATEGNALQGAEPLHCILLYLHTENELTVYCLQPIHTAVVESLFDCYKAFAD